MIIVNNFCKSIHARRRKHQGVTFAKLSCRQDYYALGTPAICMTFVKINGSGENFHLCADYSARQCPVTILPFPGETVISAVIIASNITWKWNNCKNQSTAKILQLDLGAKTQHDFNRVSITIRWPCPFQLWHDFYFWFSVKNWATELSSLEKVRIHSGH